MQNDERWSNITVRRNNAESLVRELDAEFAKRTYDEWCPVLDEHNVWFAPVNTITQALQDPAVRAAGAFTEIAGPDGPVPMINTPAEFYGTPHAARGLPPELGQHTEEVLLEMGHDWGEIIAMKEAGAIP
jgi:crotonobetainyl-CoA:carnitine CoA-transferase CaiB-like acyl-CoA transferase